MEPPPLVKNVWQPRGNQFAAYLCGDIAEGMIKNQCSEVTELPERYLVFCFLELILGNHQLPYQIER
jgi:hypothetical protein